MPIRCDRAAGIATALTVLLGSLAAAPAAAQQAAARAGSVTLLSSPPGARVAIRGTSGLAGPAPLELPAGWAGRYSVQVGAPGYATGQGVIAFPTGGTPYSLSEAPGLSTGLMVRALNLPGIPDISSGRKARGLLLTSAALGAGVGALSSQRAYERDLDRPDLRADDRAEDGRFARNRWLVYGGGVWALSAVDYMVRARVRVMDTAPDRMTLGTPKVTRGGIFWRSLLVPGAGQEFANQRGRGVLWLGTALAAGAGFVIAEGEVSRRQTEAKWALVLVDSAGPSELPVRIRDLESARRSLDSAHDLQRGFRVAAIALYAVNLVDALTLPIRRDDGPGPPKFSLSAPVRPDRADLSLTYRF